MRVESNNRFLLAKGSALGLVLASAVLLVLLGHWHVKGTPTPPAVSAARFSVAVLAGPKQSAQTAPENTEAVVESVAPAPEQVEAPPVTAKRDTSLPEAVSAAQQATPGPEATKPVEVLPPSQVSMPGGQLVAEDSPVGGASADPFEVRPRQVFIRLLVNEQGKVVNFGVIRSGGDPLRDGLILKAMRSRTYDTKQLRMQVQDKVWQLDMVIDYGNNDFLP